MMGCQKTSVKFFSSGRDMLCVGKSPLCLIASFAAKLVDRLVILGLAGNIFAFGGA